MDYRLWEHFAKAASVKTPNSIRLSWTKGHATTAHVELGITTEANREGNRIADLAADDGVRLHGDETHSLARLLTARHKAYSAFMYKVIQHIVEAHLIHKELVRIQDCKDAKCHSQHNIVSMYAPLAYGLQGGTSKLSFITSIRNFKKEVAAKPHISHAEDFLKELHVQPTSSGVRGITWLELYILYRCSGYPKPIANPLNVGFAKPTLHEQIGAFKCCTKSIVMRALDSNACGSYFKPYVAHVQQYKGLAIEAVHAAISFNIALSQETVRILAAQLVKLTRRCNANVIRSFLDAETGLKSTKLTTKGKSGWDDNIVAARGNDSATGTSPVVLVQQPAQCELQQMPISILICLVCKAESVARIAKLQQDNLDIKIKCDNCCIRPPSRDWKCNCQVRWHTCLRHVCVTAIHKAKGKPNPITSKASKRLLKNATVGQLLDDDLQRESKLAKRPLDDDIITLEDKAPMASAIKPNMIPQSLKDRFPDAMRALGSQ